MHVVAVQPSPVPIAQGRLVVHAVPMLEDNLAWLIVDPARREAALVDAPHADAVLAACEALGVRLTAVLITHAHGDHVGVMHVLAKEGRLTGLSVYGSARIAAQIPGLTHPLEDGDRITFGGVEGHALLTEGHVEGHMSFVLDDAVFPGDTLFAGGCGFLFQRRPELMAASLRRLAALPPETRIFCAHEYTEDNLRFALSVDAENPALRARWAEVRALRADGKTTLPSTLAAERATNPFLRALDSSPAPAIVASIASQADAIDPADPDALFAAARRLKDAKRYRTLPLPT